MFYFLNLKDGYEPGQPPTLNIKRNEKMKKNLAKGTNWKIIMIDKNGKKRYDRHRINEVITQHYK